MGFLTELFTHGGRDRKTGIFHDEVTTDHLEGKGKTKGKKLELEADKEDRGKDAKLSLEPPRSLLEAILTDDQEDIALAFNPEQPRKPKGSEGGGQFTKVGSFGGMKTIKYGSLKVQYTHHSPAHTRIDGPSIPLPNYKQKDDHSCGFVAALAVAHHFDKTVPPRDILKIVRPSKSGGINRYKLVKAFKQLGVKAQYKSNLNLGSLRSYVEKGIPVLVTIWPEDWSSDHWTAVQGFSDTRIYLSNYKSLTFEQFKEEWFDKGEGLVCERSPYPPPKKSKSLSTDDNTTTAPIAGVVEIEPDTTLISVGSEGSQSISSANEATVDNKPEKVYVCHDWDELKAVVVGRIDNDVFAPVPWQPSVKGLPKKGGIKYRDFAPEQYDKAVEQLDNLVKVLEKEGVKVYRPPLVSEEEALQSPVGLTQVYVREAFSVIDDVVFINQARTPYRRKESRAIASFFRDAIHLPLAPDDIEDSNLDDPLPYLEGGDVYRLGDNALITISGLASSPAGFRFVADYMQEKGVEVWPVYLNDQYEHGDYILMLVREGLCIAHKKGFKDGLLPTPIADWDCIEITSSEADPGLCANGIVLRENVAILPENAKRVIRALEKKGVDVIPIPFDGVHFFQGGIDCATNEIWREAT